MRELIIILLLFALMIGIVGGIFWAIQKQVGQEDFCNISCQARQQRLKCEDAGGIFFGGGLFGSSNCVFPPK